VPSMSITKAMGWGGVEGGTWDLFSFIRVF